MNRHPFIFLLLLLTHSPAFAQNQVAQTQRGSDRQPLQYWLHVPERDASEKATP